MGGGGMTPAQRAFLDAQVALSAWRAAKDVEARAGEAMPQLALAGRGEGG